ncbi:MAG: hypothetical protein ABSC19_03100 [Syntrophorhabdales bacterium]|jgi:hypothetical protein
MKPISFSISIIVLSCLLITGYLLAGRASLGAGQTVNRQAGPLAVYIIDPTTRQKILPDTAPRLFPVPGSPFGNTISMSACRGQFEAASIVLRPTRDMSGVTVEVSDLTGPNGSAIPKKDVDVRVVKCWYQGGTAISRGTTVLVPELLLKDDNLVRVDRAARKNYLRVTIGGEAKYVDISSPDAVFPSNAELQDAKTLQPFGVTANTNKQVWLTVHVPADAASGRYMGTISLKSASSLLGSVNIALTVLPFDLQNPGIDYSLYYRGQLRKGVVTEIGSELKSARQCTMELQDMKDHGVLYPTLYQEFDEMLGQALAIRKNLGLPDDKLYALGIKTGDFEGVKLAALPGSVRRWKAFVSRYGYKDLYIYGKDEATGEALRAQRTAWQITHDAGAKVFAACSEDAADITGDLLDLPILGGPPKPHTVEKWHGLGKKVFLYGNPQVGIEDPDVYRRNYGIALACSGYDGEMDYAYQHAFGGSIWNDFDDKTFRDHVFAYPTSDGVIDTVEWEGFREGVDDVRYLATLSRETGKPVDDPVICGVAQSSDDPRFVRQAIVGRILSRLQETQKRQPHSLK